MGFLFGKLQETEICNLFLNVLRGKNIEMNGSLKNILKDLDYFFLLMPSPVMPARMVNSRLP